MRGNLRNTLALCGLCVVPAPGFADRSNELQLGPVSIIEDIQGVKVTVVSKSSLNLHTTPSGLSFKIKVEADLSDLQAKIGSIIDTIKLPNDNCPSYKPDIALPTIWGKELQTAGTSAILWLHGYIDVWSCVQNPVPNSKVEWVMKKIGPIKTKVPKVVTWQGNPIKNKDLTQPFDISESAQLVKVDDHTVALQLGSPDVKLGGKFVFITKGILSIAGVNVNAKAKEALDKAVDPSKLKVSIPDEILQYNPRIDGASFQSVGSKLFAVIDLSADVPAVKINSVLKQLIDNAAKNP